MPDEYDDGYDSAASFEAAGADRPEDMEPDEHWTAWQSACLFYGLDESFSYSRLDREYYVNLHTVDVSCGCLPPKEGESWGPYAPRRRDGLYLESDRDYLLNNVELAVRLLDNYGAQWHGRCEEGL